MFGMHINTNCTGGFVACGRSLAGANGIAGNWAHLHFRPRSQMNWTGMIAGAGAPVV